LPLFFEPAAITLAATLRSRRDDAEVYLESALFLPLLLLLFLLLPARLFLLLLLPLVPLLLPLSLLLLLLLLSLLLLLVEVVDVVEVVVEVMPPVTTVISPTLPMRPKPPRRPVVDSTASPLHARIAAANLRESSTFHNVIVSMYSTIVVALPNSEYLYIFCALCLCMLVNG